MEWKGKREGGRGCVLKGGLTDDKRMYFLGLCYTSLMIYLRIPAFVAFSFVFSLALAVNL